MLAVSPVIPADGVPQLVEVPDPAPGPGEVLVTVAATALNRADLLQLKGLYPPPPGESAIPGLECAGTVAALGPGVQGWSVGDRVMALLAGGGQGEKVAVPEGQLLPVPKRMPLSTAAGIPEAALTAWTNLVREGGLQVEETVLITGAASGVGTFTVQLARELGARVIVAGRSRERLEGLRALGADACCVLGESFVEAVREATDGQGVDLVLDLVGGEHLPRCLEVLAYRGRLVLVGLLAGRTAAVDLGVILRQRLHVVGSVLRARSREEKAQLVHGFLQFGLPRLLDGRLKPIIDRTLPFAQVAEAYAAMRQGGILGKIVLTMEEGA